MGASKSAAGNNAVHMHVVAQLLIPGMQHLDDTGYGTEIFPVGRQFQKCLCAASVEKPV